MLLTLLASIQSIVASVGHQSCALFASSFSTFLKVADHERKEYERQCDHTEIEARVHTHSHIHTFCTR